MYVRAQRTLAYLHSRPLVSHAHDVDYSKYKPLLRSTTCTVSCDPQQINLAQNASLESKGLEV